MNKFPQWLMTIIINWLAKNLTEAKIKEWAENVKKIVIPWVREKGDALFKTLEEQAARTDTPIDDAAVRAARGLFEAFLPDNPTKLE